MRTLIILCICLLAAFTSGNASMASPMATSFASTMSQDLQNRQDHSFPLPKGWWPIPPMAHAMAYKLYNPDNHTRLTLKTLYALVLCQILFLVTALEAWVHSRHFKPLLWLPPQNVLSALRG